MAEKERQLINERLLNLKSNERLFRINAGMGWAGKIVKHTGKFIILDNPCALHAAPEGWPDLCGFESVIIDESMLGKKVAIFKAIEIKATGRMSKAQKLFRELIERFGGMYEVISNP